MDKFTPKAFITTLCAISLTLSAYAIYKVETLHEQNADELTSILLSRVKECVRNDKECKKKTEIYSIIDALNDNGTISEIGSDDLRVKYVFTQGSIEHVLSCAMVLGEVDNLIGIIHTPTPATPLCTKVDNLDEQLLDPSIRYDLEKLLTVRSRAVIVRDFLDKGGRIYVAYPKGGFEKRTQQQQEIYKMELLKYADRLFESVLSCTEMDNSKVGATYFFKDRHNNICAFSIKSSQAINPQDSSEWGLWIGKIQNPVVNNRIVEILNYLEDNDGPSIRQYL